jgi:hypothetical protein
MRRITLEDGIDEDLVVVDWDGSGWYKRVTEKDYTGSYQCWKKVGFCKGQVYVSQPKQLCK